MWERRVRVPTSHVSGCEQYILINKLCSNVNWLHSYTLQVIIAWKCKSNPHEKKNNVNGSSEMRTVGHPAHKT
jgi:hypothetical protein